VAGDMAAADWLLAGVWLRLLTCGFCVASTELASAGAVWLVTGVRRAVCWLPETGRHPAERAGCRLPSAVCLFAFPAPEDFAICGR
jgi:hypothetical protein